MADPDCFITCCDCGVRFGMSQSLNAWFRADARRMFYCPKGHEQHYSNADNDLDKMRRERDRLKQDAARMDDWLKAAQSETEVQKRQAAAYKGVATRIKNRVKQGVCPCCNRTFSNLAAHVKTKHPDFDNVVPLEMKA